MRKFRSRDEALAFVMDKVPWGNAAGTCKDLTTARKFAEVGVPHVMFGSITMKPRAGNPGDNFYWDLRTGDSINALGLPNKGLDGYLKELQSAKQMVNALGSKLWVSISAGDAFDPEEYFQMATRLIDEDAADGIEGNFSCPNVEVGGKRKPVVCFDPAAFNEGVSALCQATLVSGVPVAVKLAPITEGRLLSDLLSACVDLRVDYIVGGNTMGNCYMEKEDGTPAIAMKRGGGAGRMLRSVIRGMTQLAAPILKDTGTKFIAVGGIETGKDAYDSLCDGATGFAFNTVLSRNGNSPQVIESIIVGKEGQTGLVDLLVEKGLPH
jgi:dihydroorotate dehydrogenase (fumarate)